MGGGSRTLSHFRVIPAASHFRGAGLRTPPRPPSIPFPPLAIMVCKFPKLWAPVSLYYFCTILKHTTKLLIPKGAWFVRSLICFNMVSRNLAGVKILKDSEFAR